MPRRLASSPTVTCHGKSRFGLHGFISWVVDICKGAGRPVPGAERAEGKLIPAPRKDHPAAPGAGPTLLLSTIVDGRQALGLHSSAVRNAKEM